MYLNKAILIGNLTRDPEIKAIPSGTKVATFGIATNRVWKDKNGVKQENVDFHNIVVFGRQAEIVGQYMKKGSSILIEGRIQTRSWDDAAGVKKYRTEIIADRTPAGPLSKPTFSASQRALNRTARICTSEFIFTDIAPLNMAFCLYFTVRIFHNISYLQRCFCFNMSLRKISCKAHFRLITKSFPPLSFAIIPT